MHLEKPPVRRRGKALEDALLDAVWDELLEHGYAGLTFDGVAQRAGTSRPVLYRRWATRPDLVRAALVHNGAKYDIKMPDTGSLRGDMIAYLLEGSRQRQGLIILLAVGLGSFYEETGSSIGDLRELVIAGRVPIARVLLERAVARGEADPARITPRIERLPFDLLRSELLLTLKPVPRKVIEEIVDTILLPLVAPR